MNTIDELINKYNLSYGNAEKTYNSMNKHINEIHGVNKIIDIGYLGDGYKQVKTVCLVCGNENTQVIPKSKWYKVRTTCCNQERHRRVVSEKSRKAKKALWMNEGLKHIGKIYGDYEVIGIDATFEQALTTPKQTLGRPRKVV